MYSDNKQFTLKFTVGVKMELINSRLNQNKTVKDFYLPFVKYVFLNSYSLIKQPTK